MTDENVRPKQDETGENSDSDESRHRSQRRRFIKSTVAAVPVVLTITARTATAKSGDSLISNNNG